MTRFKEIVSALKVKDVRFLPGEHDAALDRGEAYREAFGETHYAFDHKGVHFIALDNVSEPGGAIGDAQLAWLAADLARAPADGPVVVLAHRPLFDLYPDVGLGDARRRARHRHPAAARRRHRVLRPHPPGASTATGRTSRTTRRARWSSRCRRRARCRRRRPLPWDPAEPRPRPRLAERVARERAATRIAEIAYR